MKRKILSLKSKIYPFLLGILLVGGSLAGTSLIDNSPIKTRADYAKVELSNSYISSLGTNFIDVTEDTEFDVTEDIIVEKCLYFQNSTTGANVILNLHGYLFAFSDTYTSIDVDVMRIEQGFATFKIYGHDPDNYTESNREHYFKQNNETKTYKNDAYGDKCFKGGTIANGINFGIRSQTENLEIQYCNIVGNKNGIYLENDGNATSNIISNCTIEGNGALTHTSFKDANMGGIILGNECKLLLNKSYIKSNVGYSGSGIYSFKDSLVTLVDTTIENNVAVDASGKGGANIDFSRTDFGCFVEGTQVYLADGSTTAIENIKKNDSVLTFDHDIGSTSSNNIYCVYEGEDLSSSFSLNFSNNISLETVGTHGFFCQEDNKYVLIDINNASLYVGNHFYNAVDSRWETLESVTINHEPKKYYSLTTEYDINVVANKMLTIDEEGMYIGNVFDFDTNLKVDTDKKQADIDAYGLHPYNPETSIISYEIYLTHKIQYMNIMLAKHLISYNKLLSLQKYESSASSASIKAKSSINIKKANTPLSINAETYAYNEDSSSRYGVVIGNNVVIRNNLGGLQSNNIRKESNLYLVSGTTTPLVYFVDQNVSNIDIGINTSNDGLVFSTSNTNRTLCDCFHSDDTASEVTSVLNSSTYDFSIGSGHRIYYNMNVDSSLYTGTPNVDYSLYAPSTSVTLPDATITRTDGLVFYGWSETKDGTTPLSSSYVMGDSSITLYAIWGYEHKTLKLIVKGSTSTFSNLDKGSSFDLLPHAPVMARYDFLGWSTTDGGSVEYAADAVLTIDKDYTLYAIFLGRTAQFSGTEVTLTSGVVSGPTSGYIDGDTYLNTSTFDMFRFADGKWVYIGNIKGATGDTGEKGDKGDKGDAGAKGDKGDTGAAGSNGSDGTSILTGSGVPSDSLGKDGDSYIDTSTWNFYIKSAGTWTLKGNIKGATGDTGAKGDTGNKGDKGDTGAAGSDGIDGLALLIGNGVPSETLGKDGDSYIDLDNWNYYSKSSGSWTLQGNIKGATGDKGDKGNAGEQGLKGDTGDKGEKGDQGVPGVNGTNGADGKDGTNLLIPLIISCTLNALFVLAFILRKKIAKIGSKK